MSDWIEWNGGDCPVDALTLVDVKLRNGTERSYGVRAVSLRWSKLQGYKDSDIIAYRVREEVPEDSDFQLDNLDPLKLPTQFSGIGAIQKPTDSVNHPSHYTQGAIECIDALAAATEGLQGLDAVCTANAIKYLWRWKKKGGNEDLRKARWYINKLLGDTP